MAKYTKTLAEYLAGGKTLPAIFEQIEDFTDLFEDYYYYREIGFRDESKFERKLEVKANIVIPEYVNKLSLLESAKAQLNDLTKTTSETNNFDFTKGTQTDNTNSTEQFGEQTSEETNLPFNTTTALPNRKAKNNSYSNSNGIIQTYGQRVDYNNESKSKVESLTLDEKLKLIETIKGQMKSLIENCLKEFNNLFMTIY